MTEVEPEASPEAPALAPFCEKLALPAPEPASPARALGPLDCGAGVLPEAGLLPGVG